MRMRSNADWRIWSSQAERYLRASVVSSNLPKIQHRDRLSGCEGEPKAISGRVRLGKFI